MKGNKVIKLENFDKQNITLGTSVQLNDKGRLCLNVFPGSGMSLKITVGNDTVEKEYSYEIFAVFKTTVYTKNTFRYYENINFENKKMYNDFINICKDKSLYQTGIKIKDKEKLITLSTCEYSNKNSRLVIVARKIK